MALSTKTANGIKYPVGSDILDIEHFKEMAESIDEAILPTFETFQEANDSALTNHIGLCLVNSSALDAPFSASGDWVVLHTRSLSPVQYAFSPDGGGGSIGGTDQAFVFYRSKGNSSSSWTEWKTLLRSEDIANDYNGGTNKVLSAEKGKELKGLIDEAGSIQRMNITVSPLEDKTLFWDYSDGIYQFSKNSDAVNFGYLFTITNAGQTSQTMILSNKIYIREGSSATASEWTEIGKTKTSKVYDLIIGSAAAGDTAETCDILVQDSDDIATILNSSQVPENSHIFLKRGGYLLKADATINKPLTITGEGDAFSGNLLTNTKSASIRGSNYLLNFSSRVAIENCEFRNKGLTFIAPSSYIRKCRFMDNYEITISATYPDYDAPIIFKDNWISTYTNSTLVITGTNPFIITNNYFNNTKVNLQGGVNTTSTTAPSSYGYFTNNKGISKLTIGESAKALKITNNIIDSLTLSQSTDQTVSQWVEISDNDFTSNISTSVQILGYYSKFTGNRINYYGNGAWKMANFQTGDRTGAVVGNNMINGKMDKLVFLNGEEIGGIFPYKNIYGVSIDLSNSNPETAVTYIDDAAGMTPGSSDWLDTPIFSKIRPCLFKDGAVVGYLNPDNFAQFEDGTDADITSGESGDVMIEIPKIGYKILTNGNTLTVQVTDNPKAEGFCYYAHTRDTEGDCDKLYVGAYLGYTASSKLRSLSGKSPTVNQTIGTFRTQAKANGTGYDQISFFALTLLQCLFLIKYKDRHSQVALGKGYVEASAKANTGATNANGMYYGSTLGTTHVKFAGIEDFWGNLFYWIDGLFSDSSSNILTAFDNYNDAGSGYTSRGQGATSYIRSYMSKPQGTTETGFIIKEARGSSSTYFCDYGNLSASGLAIFGGSWDHGDNAGAFRLKVDCSDSTTSPTLGGRLMYLKA